MPRERSPSRDKAKEMYLKSKGEMKLKDIATELEVLDTQIRKWKSQDKWDNELKGTLPKEMDKKKSNVTIKTNKSKNKKVPIADEVKEVLENTELNDKQRLFCIYYIKYFNATKAYQKAYGTSYDVAMANGSRLLGNAKIKAEIGSLKSGRFNRAMLDPNDIFQMYIDIARSDIKDYMKFGQKELPIINPATNEPILNEDGEAMTYTISYADFMNSDEVDGTLISEISKGKDGAKIKLHDKMKALQWLSDRMELLPIETQRKLEFEKQKLELARVKAGVNDDIEETEDDGFMDALQGTVSEVKWTDEEIN